MNHDDTSQKENGQRLKAIPGAGSQIRADSSARNMKEVFPVLVFLSFYLFCILFLFLFLFSFCVSYVFPTFFSFIFNF